MTSSTLVHPQQNNQLALEFDLSFWQAFQDAADRYAASQVFEQHHKSIKESTRRAHEFDFVCFLDAIAEQGFNVPENGRTLFIHALMHGTTWKQDGEDGKQLSLWTVLKLKPGTLVYFREWMLEQGYAISTVNRRLSTVRRYAQLAGHSGQLREDEQENEYATIKIASVKGVHGTTKIKNINEERDQTRILNDKGDPRKKQIPTSIEGEVYCLKHDYPDTPQGIRDRLLMTMLLDTGMRCSEISAFRVENLYCLDESGNYQFGVLGSDPQTTRLNWDRIKTSQPLTRHILTGAEKMDDTYRMPKAHLATPDLYHALKAYIDAGFMPDDLDAPLLRSSHRSGKLTTPGMSRGAIYTRVKTIAKACGIENVSPHDLRHNYTTRLAKVSNGNVLVMMAALNWKSADMVHRYMQTDQLAHEGLGQI